MVRPRPTFAVVSALVALPVLVAVLALATGCAGTVPTAASGPKATPTRTPPRTTTPAVPARTPAPSATVTTTQAPAGFPGAAQAYGEALLAAWTDHQLGRLSDLTTTPARQPLLTMVTAIDPHWRFQHCDGAAGSSYCSFVNVDGDVVTLRIVNQQLGTAHAITETRFDRTVFSTDARGYVQGFIEAWRNNNSARMQALASGSEVDYYHRSRPPDTYAVCAFASGAAWQVRVYNGTGLNYLVRVDGDTLGDKHAIVGHIDPAPLPAPCP